MARRINGKVTITVGDFTLTCGFQAANVTKTDQQSAYGMLDLMKVAIPVSWDGHTTQQSKLVPYEGRTEKPNKPKRFYTGAPATCDICDGSFDGTMIDGRTKSGRWACMCEACFDVDGVGLGIGNGQKYVCLTCGCDTPNHCVLSLKKECIDGCGLVG